GGVDQHLSAPGGSDYRGRALEQDRRAKLGRGRAGVLQAACLHLRRVGSQQPGQFARVRGEHGGGPAGQQSSLGRDQGQPVGLGQQRKFGRQDRGQPGPGPPAAGGAAARARASRSRADPSVPMPGPATQAWTRPAVSISWPAWAPSPVVRVSASGQCWRTTATAGPAETSRTIPAPPRRAPPTASAAAPVKRSLPATMPSTPRRYLSESPGGCRSSAATSAAWNPATVGAGRYGPSPISTSSTTPAWPAPGSISSPGFQVPKVTVTSARTAGPSTTPVSA